MPQITKLKLQKNGRIVNLYVDSKFIAGLDVLTVSKLGLKPNLSISHLKIQKLLKTSRFEKLLNKAINYLSYRPRSEKEIRLYLIKHTKSLGKNEKNKLIDSIVQKLKEQKLLNDQEFVKWWIEQRQTFRPKSKRMIAAELRQKGIKTSEIQEILSEVNEQDAVQRVIQKKMKTMKNLDRAIIKNKLITFLQRRGFSWNTIKSNVDELITQE